MNNSLTFGIARQEDMDYFIRNHLQDEFIDLIIYRSYTGNILPENISVNSVSVRNSEIKTIPKSTKCKVLDISHSNVNTVETTTISYLYANFLEHKLEIPAGLVLDIAIFISSNIETLPPITILNYIDVSNSNITELPEMCYFNKVYATETKLYYGYKHINGYIIDTHDIIKKRE